MTGARACSSENPPPQSQRECRECRDGRWGRARGRGLGSREPEPPGEPRRRKVRWRDRDRACGGREGLGPGGPEPQDKHDDHCRGSATTKYAPKAARGLHRTTRTTAAPPHAPRVPGHAPRVFYTLLLLKKRLVFAGCVGTVGGPDQNMRALVTAVTRAKSCEPDLRADTVPETSQNNRKTTVVVSSGRSRSLPLGAFDPP